MAKKLSPDIPGKEKLEQFLKQMLLIRRFEERAAQAYGLRKIGGFLHLYIGQEAVAVGSIGLLDLSRDYVVTAYRDHGHALACGIGPDACMAELFGKATGCSKGKGGSMHFFSAEKHMLGGNGIVGSQIPVATGVALKLKYKKENGVVLCFFGDGAIHQGAFHESLNLASVWKLPIVYICENNQYGMGTDYRRVSSVTDFSIMGASYGIQGMQIDGMDITEVCKGVSQAIDAARNQGVPGFIDIRTYRYKGHSMSDPGKYRSKEEVDSFKQQDPILLLKNLMIEKKMLTHEQYEQMDETAKTVCAQAVEFAESSPEPEAAALYEDILV